MRGWRIRIGLFVLAACAALAVTAARSWLGAQAGVTKTTNGWSAVWYVDPGGLVDLGLDSRDGATWRINGHPAIVHAAGEAASRRTVMLSRGFHPIDVDAPGARDGDLALSWGRPNDLLRPLDRATLLRTPPAHPRIWIAAAVAVRWGDVIARVLLVVMAIVAAGAVGERAVAAVERRGGAALAKRMGRLSAGACVIAVLAYGAALRLHAITGTYGVVTSPAWMASLQTSLESPLGALQPAGINWTAAPLYPHANGTETHYRSDPYTYLEYARAMRHFSDAHAREPVFPFVTKTWLRLLAGQDVAVSFASAMFAVLTILATYLLGALAFSRPVGVAAAAAFAIEYTAIAWNIAGWRDEAFTFATVMFAYAVLRATRWPSTAHAVLVGALAALAILVRITALSFVVPGLVWLLFVPAADWGRRARLTALALGVTAVLVSPYLINCWRVFGDPLYAINAVTPNLPDSQSTESHDGAFHYLRAKLAARPFQMLDTAALGMTEHPFTNKWDGFQPWIPGYTLWVAFACLVGLLLCVRSSAGRLLLLIVIAATVPFSLTWQLASDWRYTEHAYPFFLIAAALAAATLLRLGRPSVIRGFAVRLRERLSNLVPGLLVPAATAVCTAVIAWGIPVMTARETLRAGGPAAIVTGPRDRVFYRAGWSEPVASGNVTWRYSNRSGTVWIPLDTVDDYVATLRLDPFPRPLPSGPAQVPLVRVSLNGTSFGLLDLQWNPERVGSYDVTLPRRLVRPGFNRLGLDVVARDTPLSGQSVVPQPGVTDGAGFAMWYVLIRRST